MLIELIQNAALLITLSALYGLLSHIRKARSPHFYKIISGLLFGLMAVTAMNLPFHYQPGIIYDGRSIIMTMAGLFGGGIVSLVSIIIAGAYRIYLGGEGMWAGLAIVFFCTITGLVFRRLADNRPESISLPLVFLLAISTHMVMLVSQFFLPWAKAFEIIRTIWPTVLLVYPIATMVIWALLSSENHHRQAEKDLRTNEKKLRIMLRSIGDAVIATDNTGAIIHINPVAQRLTGWDEKEALGQPLENIFRIINEHTRQKVDSPVSKVITLGTVVGLANHTLLIAKDGTETPIADSGAPIKDDSGTITGVVLVFRDQTEERQAQQKIESSERRFRSLFENTPVGIFSTTSAGEPLLVNPAMAAILGYSTPAETIKNYSDIAHTLYVNPARRHEFIKLLRQHGEVKNFEYEARKADGTHIWLNMNAKMSQIQSDGTFLIDGFTTDITHRRQAEKSLELRNEAIESAIVGIAIVNKNGNYVYLNQAHRQIYGYETPAEMAAQSWRMLYNEDELKRFEQEIMPDFQKKGFWHGEALGMKKDGSLFPQSLSLTALKNGGLICVVRDITERKKLEEQLRQSQKMEAIGKLAGGIAHDFNNLLTVINGYTEMLLSEMNPDQMEFNDLQQIKHAGLRATTLTRQLLAFSRKQVLRLEPLNMNQLLKNLENMLRRLIGEDIILETKFCSDLHDVKADHGQQEQIIINMAVNARDAMPRGGKITIRTQNVILDAAEASQYETTQSGEFVVTSITDTGIGMSSATLKKIFEPFFTTKGVGEGTGLGLSTVYGIIKQCGGTVRVESELGCGSTFYIYLPAVLPAEKPIPEDSKQLPDLIGTETILVVEDEIPVQKLIQKTLQKRGYQLLIAGEGEEALRIAQNHPETIHLLLTDVVMPIMSGKELSEKIGAVHPETTICFMSGYTDDAVLRHGILNEHVNFIQKPFTPRSLAKKIRILLDSNHASASKK